jgi:uncharacterized protein
MGPVRMLAWQSPPGPSWQVDTALVDAEAGSLHATGTQISLDPLPYRMEWALETSEPWVTRRLTVWVQGEGWSRSLHLTHDGAGDWRYDAQLAGDVDLPAPAGETGGLRGALDCDLGRCPLTNTMPVLRHGLHRRAGSRDFLMAWVSVPGLRLVPMRQRYEHVSTEETGGSRVRYANVDGTFTAQLHLDAEGFVLDYPGLTSRVRA